MIGKNIRFSTPGSQYLSAPKAGGKYRGTHAKYEREVVWREAWFARLYEGQIVEGWPVIDESSFFRHLGYQLIPPST